MWKVTVGSDFSSIERKKQFVGLGGKMQSSSTLLPFRKNIIMIKLAYLVSVALKQLPQRQSCCISNSYSERNSLKWQIWLKYENLLSLFLLQTFIKKIAWSSFPADAQFSVWKTGVLKSLGFLKSQAKRLNFKSIIKMNYSTETYLNL